MRQEKGFRRHLSHFGRHSCNHSILILLDMPQTQKGSWFLHYKEKMDVEVIRMPSIRCISAVKSSHRVITRGAVDVGGVV